MPPSSLIKINAHGHLLPEPHQIPAFMREKKVFWIDDDRRFMRQGDWARPVTDPSFFLTQKLDWMEKNDISHEVVLTLSQLYCNGMETALAKDVICFQNDFNAQIQAENPKKFTSGFVVQPAYLENALVEIRRCVEVLGLNLLCLPTHYLKTTEMGKTNPRWTSVADPELAPLWELASHYKLAIEIHPYNAPQMVNLGDQFWRFHLVWMCAQTADTYHFFTSLDCPHKYPGARVCFAHGNQFGQVNVGRRKQGFDGRPDLFQGAVDPKASIGASNVWFDTLVHDVLSFRLLLDRQGLQSIVAGIDDPYPLGEMESVPGCYPGKVIDEALEAGYLSLNDRQLIWRENVMAWVAGQNQIEFSKRTGIFPPKLH